MKKSIYIVAEPLRRAHRTSRTTRAPHSPRLELHTSLFVTKNNMSRTGKLPIKIPAGTDLTVAPGEIIVKGKGGTLKRATHPAVTITVQNGEALVTPSNNTRVARALWGTYAAHIRNMIAGVNTPFSKKLQVEGIGYRVELSGKQIKLSVGFSHPVLVQIP
ncbi:MAG: 50S ribosomal protein L6, nonfunctional, partial [Candidatus Kaiserbacteria bacterium GW2011_GWA2_58_9]